MHLEIVTHCYRYPSLLRYQLSSLVLWPPAGMTVTMTVFYTKEDEPTAAALSGFVEQCVSGVCWKWWPLPVLELCRRSIGRNLAALATEADWVWFCDADYWFGAECWDALTGVGDLEAALIYPREVLTHRTHELGDACIQQSLSTQGLLQADRSEFEPRRMRRAIGGIQLARGEVCRSLGYLTDSRRAQSPALLPEFTRCKEDVWFRRSLNAKGVALDIPGVYRIRHSKAGRNTPGLLL